MMLLILPTLESRAAETELVKMRATAYCLQGKTCTGMDVQKGICATGNKAYIGKIAVIYQRLPDGSKGRIIGIYDVQDSGCSKYVLDIWCPDKAECQLFMNEVYEDGCQGKIYVSFIDP